MFLLLLSRSLPVGLRKETQTPAMKKPDPVFTQPPIVMSRTNSQKAKAGGESDLKVSQSAGKKEKAQSGTGSWQADLQACPTDDLSHGACVTGAGNQGQEGSRRRSISAPR